MRCMPSNLAAVSFSLLWCQVLQLVGRDLSWWFRSQGELVEEVDGINTVPNVKQEHKVRQMARELR